MLIAYPGKPIRKEALHTISVAGIYITIFAEQATIAVAREAAFDGLHLHFVEFDFAGEGVQAEAVVYFFHSAATVYKSKRGQNFRVNLFYLFLTIVTVLM